MANKYGVWMRNEAGTITKLWVFPYWTTYGESVVTSSYSWQSPSVYSGGTAVVGTFVSTPPSIDTELDEEEWWEFVDTGYWAKFTHKHTSGSSQASVSMTFYNSNKTTELRYMGGLSYALPTYEQSDPTQAPFWVTPVISPIDIEGDADNITYIGEIRYSRESDGYVYCNRFNTNTVVQAWKTVLGSNMIISPSYPSGGVEPVDVFGGDENNFDSTSDDIGVPEPLTGALDNGFVKSYLISAQQLYQFMADITNFNSSSVTDFFNNISLLFNNPIDAIISVKKFCLDFTQFPISNAENVYLMSLQTTATANPIYQQYIKLDIGSIDIDEYFGGFLDYPPYTRITIYLPFIGEQELNVQEVMGATIHLYYMIDFLTGHCVAHLNVNKTAGDSNINSDLYQWEGNMACDIPITGQDWHQVLGNFGKNAVLDITSGLTGNIGGVLNGIDGMMASPNTGKVLSGAISGASALMGVRVPYIKIENAIQSMPDNFTELKGMRDGIQHTISELSGYASIMAVNIDNVTATDDEKSLIKSILMEGIII